MLLGARWNHHHGYTLKQAMLITGSPTVFGVLLALRSTPVLLTCGVANALFMVVTALTVGCGAR